MEELQHRHIKLCRQLPLVSLYFPIQITVMIIIIIIIITITLGNHDPEGDFKIRKIYKSWVCLVIRAVTIWQTVVQKKRVKALYQD